MLHSFKLKSGGASLPEVSRGKINTKTHSNIIKPDAESELRNKKIYGSNDVDIQPSFGGGEFSWKKYLRDSLRTDLITENHVPKGKYSVKVSFVVNVFGPNTSDVKALNDPGYGMAQEAVRVIKQNSGWGTALKNGRSVNCRIIKTITFEVDE